MKLFTMLLSGVVLFVTSVTGQKTPCNIKSRVNPDGTMYFYGEDVLLYKTKALTLIGKMVTDNENYFLTIQPMPYPEKKVGLKLKDDIEVKLANDSLYKLKFYDGRYMIGGDSLLNLVYLINKDEIKHFSTHEMTQLRIDLGKGEQTYKFVLHTTAIKDQLLCLRKKKNKGGQE